MSQSSSAPHSRESLTPESAVEPPNGNGLPARPVPKMFANNDSHSGSGTPIGFQRYPHNKHLDHAAGSDLRHPSPQPTHLGIPGAPHHRVLSEGDPGYIAAKFEGKDKQMTQGMPIYPVPDLSG